MKTCSICGKKHYAKGFCKNCYMKNYLKEPEIRARHNKYMREYLRKAYADPEFRAKHLERVKIYESKPETKLKKKLYRQKPEVHKRHLEYMKRYNQKPEVKAKAKAYRRKYYQQKKLEGLI